MRRRKKRENQEYRCSLGEKGEKRIKRDKSRYKEREREGETFQHTLNGCSSSKTWQLNCRDKYGDTNHKIVCVGRSKMERDRYMCK